MLQLDPGHHGRRTRYHIATRFSCSNHDLLQRAARPGSGNARHVHCRYIRVLRRTRRTGGARRAAAGKHGRALLRLPAPGVTAVCTQIGGGGTYAAIGARMWCVDYLLFFDLHQHVPARLPAPEVGAVIDRGHDFPPHIQAALDSFGHAMWLFRDNPDRETTRSRNMYRAGVRSSVMPTTHALLSLISPQ
jgi:hypothetical protein